MGTSNLPNAPGRDRHLIIGELIFGLRERLQACDELAGHAQGNPIAAADLLDTIDQITARGEVLRSLGLGQ